jgi:hypothetical protein
VLRRYSQQHNIKLRDVAGGLITTGRLPAEMPELPDPDGPMEPSIAG